MILREAHGPLTIEAMNPADLPAVMEIEQGCHVEPWRPQFFLEEMGKAHSTLLVARHPAPPSILLGYICFWQIIDEVQVFNLAVHPAHRRRGIGCTLLLRALQQGYEQGARIALLEVRRSNEAAQSLYTRLGFKAAGVRPNYYGGWNEPALLMELEMTRNWKAAWLADPIRFPHKED